MDASWQLDRPERVRALARFTALTPSHPSSACEPPTTIIMVPVCRIPVQPRSLLVRCAPARPWPSSGLALAQLPTMLKGQGPPATQPICQAADQSLGSEKRDTNTRHPLSQLSAQSSTEKCQIKDAL